MASIKNKLYLWDFAFQFSDLLEFIEFSERNLEWQRRSHVQSLDRKAKLQKYEPSEYYSERENIEGRFDINLSRSIRYSAIIALATSVEWVAKFLEKRLTSKLPPKPKGANESIHILRTLFRLADCDLVHNLETLEKIIKIRNCIAHAMGSVENYEHGEEIAGIVRTLKGFGISDKHFINGTIDIEKGAVEAIIQETQVWILDFIEECRQKSLINIS
jgi:hypothetical protein